jgi:hypothetical protein|tara:strand:- start:363 stop:530 length:168 start_codon:yes stop_codon:yes gene_type:complete
LAQGALKLLLIQQVTQGLIQYLVHTHQQVVVVVEIIVTQQVMEVQAAVQIAETQG